MWIVIANADDLTKERDKMNKVFGDSELDDYDGLVSWNEYTFGIFLTCDATHRTIAHEVFHLTHRILDYRHADYDVEYDEPAAYLCGYLTDLVYGVIDQNGQAKNITQKDKK